MARTVLIVDDSVSIRLVMRATLERAGLSVVDAPNVPKALFKIASLDALDLVITDINMPGINGVDLIRQIRSKSPFPDVPILVVSTEHQSTLSRQALAEGALKIITKPFSPEELLDVATRILG